MLFKPSSIDEACVQAQYLENIGKKKGQPSSSKRKESQDATMEDEKKWKRKDKKITIIEHQCKDPKIHCNHCNIICHNKVKCWKLYPELNPKNCKKDENNKNMLAMDSSNQVERNLNVEKHILCTTVQMEVNLNSLYPQEEKEIIRVFHINIHARKTKMDSLFDYGT